ncbi:MAG: hypothetical protein QOE79_2631 [Sphingomonadales bacterium]|nr:hypothetical protein [Sphingomonadales bacterium]
MRRLSAALLLLAAAPAGAEVRSATASGFEVRSVAVVKASPEAAWAMIVRPAAWWNPEHSWSGKAANLTIDPRAGGCFCEAVPPGGSVEHGRVLSAMPGRLLLLEAPLGPLQALAVTTRLSWRLKPVAGGTEITQTYVAGGYLPMGGDALAPAVDGVLSEQLVRLKASLDH